MPIHTDTEGTIPDSERKLDAYLTIIPWFQRKLGFLMGHARLSPTELGPYLAGLWLVGFIVILGQVQAYIFLKARRGPKQSTQRDLHICKQVYAIRLNSWTWTAIGPGPTRPMNTSQERYIVRIRCHIYLQFPQPQRKNILAWQVASPTKVLCQKHPCLRNAPICYLRKERVRF